MDLRKYFCVIILQCILNCIYSYNTYSSVKLNSSSLLQVEEINNLDTVFFDFDKSTITGQIIEIPVYIDSDDNIYTLDFSFILDTTKLKYVSLVDYTGHIQHTEFFNPANSKFKFTSNSFEKYPKGSKKVVGVKFLMLTGNVRKSNFTNNLYYLNGDLCSYRIRGNDIIMNGVYAPLEENIIEVRPNPAQDFVILRSTYSGVAEIIDGQGRTIINNIDIVAGHDALIDIRKLINGFYYVIANNGSRILSKKLIINH